MHISLNTKGNKVYARLRGKGFEKHLGPIQDTYSANNAMQLMIGAIQSLMAEGKATKDDLREMRKKLEEEIHYNSFEERKKRREQKYARHYSKIPGSSYYKG